MLNYFEDQGCSAAGCRELQCQRRRSKGDGKDDLRVGIAAGAIDRFIAGEIFLIDHAATEVESLAGKKIDAGTAAEGSEIVKILDHRPPVEGTDIWPDRAAGGHDVPYSRTDLGDARVPARPGLSVQPELKALRDEIAESHADDEIGLVEGISVPHDDGEPHAAVSEGIAAHPRVGRECSTKEQEGKNNQHSNGPSRD